MSLWAVKAVPAFGKKHVARFHVWNLGMSLPAQDGHYQEKR